MNDNHPFESDRQIMARLATQGLEVVQRREQNDEPDAHSALQSSSLGQDAVHASGSSANRSNRSNPTSIIHQKTRQDGVRKWSKAKSQHARLKDKTGTSGAKSRTSSRNQPQTGQQAPLHNFVVGIDYGTTFTSVSWVSYPVGEKPAQILHSDMKSIVGWPNDPMGGSSTQVPTESWYPLVPLGLVPEDTDDIAANSDDDDDPNDERLLSAGIVSETLANSNPSNTSRIDTDASPEFLWGWGVSRQEYECGSRRSRDRLVRRPKLMLVHTKHTKEDQAMLRPVIENLIKLGLVRRGGEKDSPSPRDVQDIITDFLVQVLRHTKEQLEVKGYSPKCSVYFALSVPSIWSSSSSHVLQTAMEIAIQLSGFGTLKHGSIDNLFLVYEPEAAIEFLISQQLNMLPGEALSVLDCGGGTVDCSTYNLENSFPLKLGGEIGSSNGDNCGASYLNVSFEKLLVQQLSTETYLNDNGNTVESLVRECIPTFEVLQKRAIDITRKQPCGVKITGLKGRGEDSKFARNWIFLDRHDLDEIFRPLLERSWDVLCFQLKAAMLEEKSVSKVLLIGGFGASPSMYSFLRKRLDRFTKYKLNYEIELVKSNADICITAVASGAVMKAFQRNLDYPGAARPAMSSYGFMRNVPYDPRRCRSHIGAPFYIDDDDGQKYVEVIEYFILKGKSVDSDHQYAPIHFVHHFQPNRRAFVCTELLYVSHTATQSGFHTESAMNKGAEIAGTIETDLTFLLDKKIIQPQNHGNAQRGKYYKVEYALVPSVSGMNLRYEARWASSTGDETVLETKQTSIAPAFRPGTT